MLKLFVILFTGVAQGVVTGIRGLCNGLGPALFGFVFYLFNVDLNENSNTDGPISEKPKDNNSNLPRHNAIEVSPFGGNFHDP